MKINFVNRKLISAALAFTMCTTVLTGCDKYFKYEEQEDGQVLATGQMSYDTLSSCKVIEVNVIDKSVLYLARKEVEKNDNNFSYYDLFTNLKIYSSQDNNDRISVVNEYRLGDYLVNLNYLKKNYTEEDLTKILDSINEDYIFANEKELVK